MMDDGTDLEYIRYTSIIYNENVQEPVLRRLHGGIAKIMYRVVLGIL